MTHSNSAAQEPASAPKATAQRISIALCTYNGARFIEPQLDSFLAQTRLPDELVVCDDASTDGTLAILEAFAKRAAFPVRIVRNETRLGSTKNFEKAIGLCSGEFIATSDQDDVWLPEKLILGAEAFATDPARGLIFTDAEVVDEALRPIGHHMWDAIHFGMLARRHMRGGRSFEVLLRQWVVTGSTMMFRSEYRPFILPIPGIWVHDGWIAFIIAALAPVGFIERPTLKYRQHAAQLIGGRKFSLRDLYRMARELGPEYFYLHHQRFVLAQERLRELAARVREPRFLTMLEHKVLHQQRRLAISREPSRRKRVQWTLGELLRGGYQRYSPTTTHCLKDMIF